MAAKVILIAGPPGSGKTTLVGNVIARHPNAQAIRYGDLLFEHVGRPNGIETHEEFRTKARSLVSIRDVRDIDEVAVGLAKSWADDSLALIELHTVTVRDYGYTVIPYTPDRLHALNPQGLLFLRRKGDGGRRMELADKVLDHLLLLQEIATLGYSITTGAPLYILNDSLDPGATAEAALGFIQSL